MTSFFDDLRRNIQESLSGISRTSENVMQRTGDIFEAQKARVQKASLENDLIDIYAEIGKLFTEKTAAEDVPEEYAELFTKLGDCKAAITGIENKIAALKGVKICPECSAEVQKDAAFCPHCGAKLPEPEPEPVEEAAETEEAAEAKFEEVKEAAEGACEEVKEAAAETVEGIKEAAEGIKEELKDAAEEAVEAVKEEAENVADKIKDDEAE
ncbi:MAG: zinc ribbon domain-containing protein [Lachnospiraceae bacterium]|nr:zinc ribbon domain-containing protein [Lachnospiraceae bacterium]